MMTAIKVMIRHRPEIEGLRGVAVLFVCFFHASIPPFAGGYIGVDVFFVISGYLITNIILRDLYEGRFSIIDFYDRRVRRIFPALALVLLFSVMLGLCLLLPDELDMLGESVFASALFYANYFFMLDGHQYFSGPSELKPLLHTWSLSVEEQYYLVYPLVLSVVFRYFPNKINLLIATTLVVSFIYNVSYTSISPNDAFYSTPARVWELLLGSVVAIYPGRKETGPWLGSFISFFGLSLIAYAALFFSKEDAFPGFLALFPVVGAAFIIYGGGSKNIVNAMLSSRVLRFFGAISYSLYLWHWVILVFLRLWKGTPLSGGEKGVYFVITVLISYVSWKYVENPFRIQGVSGRVGFVKRGVSVMCLIGVLGLVAHKTDGLPLRFGSEVNLILSAQKDTLRLNDCQNIYKATSTHMRFCNIGARNSAAPSFIVWGDSHGRAMLPAINEAANNKATKGVFFGKGGCLPLIGARQSLERYEECDDMAEMLVYYLSEHPEIKQIIIVSRWALYAMGERFKNEKGRVVYIKDDETEVLSLAENKRVFKRAFDRTMRKLASLGRQVIIVNQVPETELDIPTVYARANILHNEIELRPSYNDYLSRQSYVTRVINETSPLPIVINPQDIMCNEEYCSVLDNMKPIYRDTNHITASYAAKLAALFEPLFK